MHPASMVSCLIVTNRIVPNQASIYENRHPDCSTVTSNGFILRDYIVCDFWRHCVEAANSPSGKRSGVSLDNVCLNKRTPMSFVCRAMNSPALSSTHVVFDVISND